MLTLTLPKSVKYFAIGSLRNLLAASLLTSAAAAPNAIDDTGSTDEDSLLTVVDPGATSSLFANDTPAILNLISADASSASGASVTVNADGTFSYDPTGAPALQALPLGVLLNDTFDYTVSEGAPVPNEDGLLSIRLVKTNGPNPGTSVNSWFNLFNALDGLAPGTTGNPIAGYNVQFSVDDTEVDLNYGQQGNFNPTTAINTINGDGPGGAGGPFNGGNDYAIRGEGYLRFTAGGTYSIALGSDDGRRIELTEAFPGGAPGYTGFTARGDQVSGGFAAGDTVVFRDGGTGHAQSVGVFDVAAGDILFLSAFYFQGGGGHSGEIMIKSGSDLDVPGGNNSDPQATNDGWALLSDGVAGIELSSAANLPSTDTATVTVTVVGVNDLPVANDATHTVSEDGPAITHPFTASDTDMPETLSFSAVTSPASGLLTDNGNGTFTFDPNGEFESLSQGQPTVVSFDFEVADMVGATDTGTVTIVVQGVNDDPTPMPDGAMTDEDTLLAVLAADGLLSNDGDTDGDSVGVQSIDTTGAVGTVVADLMGLNLGSGLSGTFYDYNAGTPAGFTLNNNNSTANQPALLLPLREPGCFVLQRMGLTPSATVITPRVDFGTGTNTTQGDGSVLNRGGFSSGGEPPWQGLFNDVGETADMDGDQVAGIWTGKIQITTGGAYTFTTRSDDGTVLFINGARVVDNNRFQGMTNRSGTVTLDPGLHDICIGGYEGGGGAGMQASYEGPDTAGRIIIPPSVLFNDVATSGTFVSGGLRGDYYDTNNPTSNGGFNLNIDEFLFFPTTPEMDVAQEALFAEPANTGVLSPRLDFGNDTRVIPGDGSNPERGGIGGNIYGGIGVSLDGDQIGGVWRGSLLVPETADFRIWQRVDDGGLVMIDVDGNGSVHDPGDFVLGQGNADGTITNLSAGAHKIVVASREGGGDHRMVVSWEQLTGVNPFPREVVSPANLVLPGAAMVGDGSYTFDPSGLFESLNVGDMATTTFSYVVTDPFGNTATETVTVTVKGVNDPPAVTPPGIPSQTIFTSTPTLDVSLFGSFEDVDNGDSELTYTVTANTDGVLIQTDPINSSDGILTLNTPCDLVGTADITVTAEDPGGLSVSDTFTVTVVDDVAPECPPLPKLFVTAPGGATSAVVNFGPFDAQDKVDGAVAMTCSPPSGSVFDWGATVVTCTAIDASGNAATCSFMVAVKLPGDVLLQGPRAGSSTAGNATADPAPGVAANFGTIRGAHLARGGHLLVEAEAASARGLWAGELGSLGLVAHAGSTTPSGAPAPVIAFDRFAIAANGGVGYYGRLGEAAPAAADEGMWSWSGGTTTAAGVLGGVAPGTGGETFKDFPLGAWSFSDDGGNYFTGKLAASASVDGSNDQGIWSEAGGLLLREDSPVDAIPGVRYSKLGTQMAANASGQVAYTSYLRGSGVSRANNSAVFAGDLPNSRLVARRGETAPGTADRFNIFGEVCSNDNGRVAFLGWLAGAGVTPANNIGVWADGGGTLELVAREGDAAPGLPGAFFESFSSIKINDKGEVLFLARLVGSMLDANSDDALYGYSPGGGLQLAAGEGEMAPGTPSVWIAIRGFSAHEGGDFAINGILMRGTGGVTRKNDHGVWTFSALGATPSLLVRGGDPFDDADGDGDDEVVHRPYISYSLNGGASGRSGAIACGNIAVVVSYDQGRQTAVWVLGVPD